MSAPNEPTTVKPGNALRLIAIFAQPPVPSFPPSTTPPIQSIELPNGEVVTVTGTLFNPPGPLVVVLHGADGSQTTLGTPTSSSTGLFYVDALIPLSAWPGIWNHRWYQQGVPVDSNFLQEHSFEVVSLDF